MQSKTTERERLDDAQERTLPQGGPPDQNMVWLSGGTFLMGSNDHYPEEAPAHPVTLAGFWIDSCQTTNAQFRRFVKATGYITMAERIPNADDYPGAIPEMLVPGSIVFQQPPRRVDLRNHYSWWDWVPGANWSHPEGPQSNLAGKDRHPVVHIAWEDATAYASWVGKDIPTEAEWEYAARGGLEAAPFAWGHELEPRGRYMANYWQGEFPWHNARLDGFERTAPVKSFPPNGYGLFDMIGNAWEWTADWYSDHHEVTTGCCSPSAPDPRGGTREESIDRDAPGVAIPRKVLKGGSWACAENYCRRYRPAARMHHPIDTGTNHLTIRCIVRPFSEQI